MNTDVDANLYNLRDLNVDGNIYEPRPACRRKYI